MNQTLIISLVMVAAALCSFTTPDDVLAFGHQSEASFLPAVPFGDASFSCPDIMAPGNVGRMEL